MTVELLAGHLCRVIGASGGEIRGRQRLISTLYLLDRAGWKMGFTFDYAARLACNELDDAVNGAREAGMLKEEIHVDTVPYSVYRVVEVKDTYPDDSFAEFLRLLSERPPVVLLLTAAAVWFRYEEGAERPWDEVQFCMPLHSEGGRLEEAQRLYAELCARSTHFEPVMEHHDS